MALVITTEQLHELVEHYRTKSEFVFDVETRGEHRSNPHRANLAWISMACDDRTDVIPMDHPNGELRFEGPAVLKSGQKKLDAGRERSDLKPYDFSKNKIERLFSDPPDQLPRHEVLEALAPLFGDEGILKIGHNVKFDAHVLRQYLGDRVAGPWYCTMIASWLLDVTRKNQLGLADCTERELGEKMEKGVGKDIDRHSFSEVAEYSLYDADATYRIKKKLDEQYFVRPASFSRLLRLENLLLEPVLDMESTGICVDLNLLQQLDKEWREDLDMLQADLYRLAGRVFNVRSTKDKQEILYKPKRQGGEGLHPSKLTDSALKRKQKDATYVTTIYDYSTDAEAMAAFAGQSKVVDAFLQFGKKAKLHSVYVLPCVGGMPPANSSSNPKYVPSRLYRGRIFGQFKQTGTESGRFSSANPNLQQIPSRSADGRRIREAFIAPPGHRLIVADYSQIEPRIIASLSGDRTMLKTYREGGDVYEVIADRVNTTRPIGKELVLSIAYGVGPHTIADRTGLTVAEARSLMQFFSESFRAIPKHRSDVIRKARRAKYSETILGRRRPLPRIAWANEEERAGAERQAYNHLIQGTAADIMKIALVNLHVALPEGARMLMTIHDEVVVEAPEDLAEETLAVVVEEMEAARPSGISVPLVAEAKIARNWLEGK